MATFKKVILVVSTGRTGTVAIARNVDSFYSKVTAVHEPKSSRWLRVLGNRYLCGRASKAQLVHAYQRSRKKLFSTVEADSIYIEANPFLHGFLDVFDDLFERPLVFHIVRNPANYITSHLNHGGLSGLRGFLSTYNTSWMLRPNEYEENPKRLWHEMSDIEKLAWRWSAINRQLDRGEKLFGERYHRVKFEELFSKCGNGIRDFVSWAKLPSPEGLIELFNNKKHNKSAPRNCLEWDAWSAEDQLSMYRHCTSGMKRYAYDLPNNIAQERTDANLESG